MLGACGAEVRRRYGLRGIPVMLASVVLLSGTSGAQSQERNSPSWKLHEFIVQEPAALVARLTVRCERCAWDIQGREAVVLSVKLDGGEPSALPITRSGRAQYRVLLGLRGKGVHHLRVEEFTTESARELRDRDAAVVEQIAVDQIAGREGFILSLAPFLYARPDTVGKFTDVPVFMWYEEEPTERGTRFRYSVIFTNEDGGTPADRLMATWGRTTDIEYIYSVEVDADRGILSEDMQGPHHEVLPFRGRRDATNPELYVSTSNNMVLDHGTTTVRYAPAPVAFPLVDVSRERVMDANPWLYEVMAKELAREGKIVEGAPPGKGAISDPRTFAFLEGCGVLGDNALSFSVQVNGSWVSSDRGVPDYRIVRDGCFRAAVPLPDGAAARDVRAVRVHAHDRKDKPSVAPVRFTRLNTLFGLDERYAPGPRVLDWTGSAELRPGGPPLEIPVK
jgi:hypothetical protein